MNEDSRRQKILEVMEARLKRITAENGFRTDAGLTFDYGPITLGPDDEKLALAMVPGTTVTNPNQGGRKIITLPIEIHIVTTAYVPQPGIADNAWKHAERILADVKQAVELDEPENKIFGGLVSDMLAGEVGPLLREEGGQLLGLRAEYLLTYPEVWGEPWR